MILKFENPYLQEFLNFWLHQANARILMWNWISSGPRYAPLYSNYRQIILCSKRLNNWKRHTIQGLLNTSHQRHGRNIYKSVGVRVTGRLLNNYMLVDIVFTQFPWYLTSPVGYFIKFKIMWRMVMLEKNTDSGLHYRWGG